MKIGQKVSLNDKFFTLEPDDVILNIKVSKWHKIFNENNGYAKVNRIDNNNGFVIVDFPKRSMGLGIYKMFLK